MQESHESLESRERRESEEKYPTNFESLILYVSIALFFIFRTQW